MEELRRLSNELSDIKVLYAEDEKLTREMTTEILKHFFKNITVCQNGQEALEAFKKDKYDLIITDINMPKLSGIDLAKEIKKINPDIPVVFTSAHNETEYFIQAINIGADGFLLKPVDIQQMIDILKKILERFLCKKRTLETKHYLKQFEDAVSESAIISKTDKKGVITFTNKNFEKISKYRQEELIGKSHNIIRHPDMPKEVFTELWDTVKNGKTFKGLIKNKDKEGKSYYVKTVIKPITDLKGEIKEFLAVREDITQYMNPKKTFFDSMRVKDDILVYMKLKNYDMLEEFYSFDIIEKIENKFLDYLYKVFNKTYTVKEIYPLGNGEYTLFIDKNFLDEHLIDNLKKIQQKIKLHTLQITDEIEYDPAVIMSVVYDGEYIYESAKLGLRKLMNGNEEFIVANNFAKEHYEKAKENIKTLNLIKKAVTSLHIINFYQGIVNNKTKQIEKYESLVRIIDDNGKIISPFFFLDAAKKGNYYHYITNIILENSFETLKKTDKEISINLSFLDIELDVIRHKIYNLLKTNSEIANRIVFELLEDESIKNIEIMKEFIEEVKKYNVKIAIDDFGSGYSNYTRLLDFQPDILKIDGSIIKNIENNNFSKSIVKSIVTFAKEQNLKTVAEFVENKNIADIVTNLGIDYSQGYYFDKPKIL